MPVASVKGSGPDKETGFSYKMEKRNRDVPVVVFSLKIALIFEVKGSKTAI